MKKLYIVTIFLTMLLSCKDNTTTPSTSGKSGIYQVTLIKYNWSPDKPEWEKNIFDSTIIKADASSARRQYQLFSELFGKNWLKEDYLDNLGCILEYSSKDADWYKIIYSYDNDKYLSFVDSTLERHGSYKTRYEHQNGRLTRITDIDSSGNPCGYTDIIYDKTTGYISETDHFDSSNTKDIICFYDHDQNGNVVKYRKSILKSKYYEYTYTYNSQGLPDSKKSIKDDENYTFKYNSTGQCIEIDLTDAFGVTTKTITYDSLGFPTEIMEIGKDSNNEPFYKIKTEFIYSK